MYAKRSVILRTCVTLKATRSNCGKAYCRENAVILHRVKRIWRPEEFHFHHALNERGTRFEGWYFKLVDARGEKPCAIIPGVFLGNDAHAFIQVLDGRTGMADYHRFPLRAFRASRDGLDFHIGRCHFTDSGITLDICADETDARKQVAGRIDFGSWRAWPVTLSSPGVMGPYSFAPFMECNHGILSMDHAIAGELLFDGITTSFGDGRGYVEKDWGRGFPSGYIWTQSNHFAKQGVSISASVAMIPWLTGAFRGHLIGFLLDGRLFRFTTYTGSMIEYVAVDDDYYHLTVRDRRHRLELRARRQEGALLHAPYDSQMLRRVAETMSSRIEVRLEEIAGGDVVFEGLGEHCCLEVQGDIGAILNRSQG